jgi:hypothetical protein
MKMNDDFIEVDGKKCLPVKLEDPSSAVCENCEEVSDPRLCYKVMPDCVKQRGGYFVTQEVSNE